MGNLWTPWRMAYLRASGEVSGEPATCIFCSAWQGADDAATLLVHRGERAFVMLNRYPYTNGHLMVAPVDHVARLGAADAATRAELLDLAALAEARLQEIYRPHGFNLGMNLGRAAGAGIAAHIHLHVVPRWDGDTNYMSAVNDVRIIPERLEDTWQRLRPLG